MASSLTWKYENIPGEDRGGQMGKVGRQEEERSEIVKLLTKEIRARLPALGTQDRLGGKMIARVKFFTPDSSWTWFVVEAGVEADGDITFFGLVEGPEKELGYFSLSELEFARGPFGLSIERDLYWEPKTLAEIAPELFA